MYVILSYGRRFMEASKYIYVYKMHVLIDNYRECVLRPNSYSLLSRMCPRPEFYSLLSRMCSEAGVIFTPSPNVSRGRSYIHSCPECVLSPEFYSLLPGMCPEAGVLFTPAQNVPRAGVL